MEHDKYLTVGALTKYLKYKFDTDNNLKQVFLKGEISNFKAHTSGHFYFSIKDETSKINAIMFSINASKINFVPQDGMKVLIAGRITVYEATGGYQVYVNDMMEDGVGNLYVAFEKLKKELEKEGLFDPAHKKKIPEIPSRIGIITAPTGAAIRDILSTIKRRFPICETILFPSLVQGEAAAKDLVKNIQLASHYDLDVLIIGRGGGSIEDMWPFNEEIVARAIYDCPIPTISAVGHEIDFTISDFVSDLRAPTPTGAAELAVPNLMDLKKHINQLQIRLNENLNQKINYNKLYLESMKSSFVIKNPIIMYENKKQMVDTLYEKIVTLITNKVEMERTHLEHLKEHYILKNPEELMKLPKLKLASMIDKLEVMNPLGILKRGYTVNYKEDSLITSVHDVKKNDILTTVFHDGTVSANIISIEVKKDGEKSKI